MYWQLFGPLQWMRICIWIGGTTLTAFYTAATIVYWYFTIQRPGKTFLEQILSPEGRKANEFAIPFYAIGLGYDVIILLLPITAVLRLQLPRHKKIGVALIFTSGIL